MVYQVEIREFVMTVPLLHEILGSLVGKVKKRKTSNQIKKEQSFSDHKA